MIGKIRIQTQDNHRDGFKISTHQEGHFPASSEKPKGHFQKSFSSKCLVPSSLEVNLATANISGDSNRETKQKKFISKNYMNSKSKRNSETTCIKSRLLGNTDLKKSSFDRKNEMASLGGGGFISGKIHGIIDGLVPTFNGQIKAKVVDNKQKNGIMTATFEGKLVLQKNENLSRTKSNPALLTEARQPLQKQIHTIKSKSSKKKPARQFGSSHRNTELIHRFSPEPHIYDPQISNDNRSTVKCRLSTKVHGKSKSIDINSQVNFSKGRGLKVSKEMLRLDFRKLNSDENETKNSNLKSHKQKNATDRAPKKVYLTKRSKVQEMDAEEILSNKRLAQEPQGKRPTLKRNTESSKQLNAKVPEMSNEFLNTQLKKRFFAHNDDIITEPLVYKNEANRGSKVMETRTNNQETQEAKHKITARSKPKAAIITQQSGLGAKNNQCKISLTTKPQKLKQGYTLLESFLKSKSVKSVLHAKKFPATYIMEVEHKLKRHYKLRSHRKRLFVLNRSAKIIQRRWRLFYHNQYASPLNLAVSFELREISNDESDEDNKTVLLLNGNYFSSEQNLTNLSSRKRSEAKEESQACRRQIIINHKPKVTSPQINQTQDNSHNLQKSNSKPQYAPAFIYQRSISNSHSKEAVICPTNVLENQNTFVKPTSFSHLGQMLDRDKEDRMLNSPYMSPSSDRHCSSVPSKPSNDALENRPSPILLKEHSKEKLPAVILQELTTEEKDKSASINLSNLISQYESLSKEHLNKWTNFYKQIEKIENIKNKPASHLLEKVKNDSLRTISFLKKKFQKNESQSKTSGSGLKKSKFDNNSSIHIKADNRSNEKWLELNQVVADKHAFDILHDGYFKKANNSISKSVILPKTLTDKSFRSDQNASINDDALSRNHLLNFFEHKNVSAVKESILENGTFHSSIQTQRSFNYDALLESIWEDLFSDLLSDPVISLVLPYQKPTIGIKTSIAHIHNYINNISEFVIFNFLEEVKAKLNTPNNLPLKRILSDLRSKRRPRFDEAMTEFQNVFNLEYYISFEENISYASCLFESQIEMSHIMHKCLFDGLNEALNETRVLRGLGVRHNFVLYPAQLDPHGMYFDDLGSITAIERACNNLLSWNEFQCGFLSKDYFAFGFVEKSYIAQIRDERMNKMIKNYAEETDREWLQIDIDSVSSKLAVADEIFDFLLAELIGFLGQG